MSNFFRFPALVLYGSAIVRATYWFDTGMWPEFALERFITLPPATRFDFVNASIEFLWALPIELWVIAPAVFTLLFLPSGGNVHRTSGSEGSPFGRVTRH
ncbi:MAG: hypothetical protein FJX42_08370 [Alphaproteobacteria bacterium]|nr:hypothetical protein [Alphaproteobacteria bacterium]